MEKNEKVKKPDWVIEIEKLLPSARQNVGTIAAATIQNLAALWEISCGLYHSVINEVELEIDTNIENNASDFVEDIIKDASS